MFAIAKVGSQFHLNLSELSVATAQIKWGETLKHWVVTPKTNQKVAALGECAMMQTLGNCSAIQGAPMLNNQFILLAEDDSNDVLLIQRAFQKAGLRNALKVTRDGGQAIDYLAGHGIYANRERFPRPFMLLLDLKMPGTDGFEVLQWVRAQPDLKRLLVVVLTSSNLQADVDRAYELGANSYLVKPVSFDEMVAMIQRFEIYWTEINRTPSSPAAASAARQETALS
jgi:CheY-like chemotaxis protein